MLPRQDIDLVVALTWAAMCRHQAPKRWSARGLGTSAPWLVRPSRGRYPMVLDPKTVGHHTCRQDR